MDQRLHHVGDDEKLQKYGGFLRDHRMIIRDDIVYIHDTYLDDDDPPSEVELEELTERSAASGGGTDRFENENPIIKRSPYPKQIWDKINELTDKGDGLWIEVLEDDTKDHSVDKEQQDDEGDDGVSQKVLVKSMTKAELMAHSERFFRSVPITQEGVSQFFRLTKRRPKATGNSTTTHQG